MWGFTATLKKSNILRDQIRPAEPFLYNLGIKENGSWYQTGAGLGQLNIQLPDT